MSSTPQPSNSKSAKTAKTTEIGQTAENFVAQWLIEQGWQVIAQRWHCRWGELDLVMLTADQVVTFIEVKARSQGNWDADGLLAITPTKQNKLVRTAQAFLSEQPQWAELPCRFDVAIVHTRRRPTPQAGKPVTRLESSQREKPAAIATYSFTLQQYIPAAFD